MFCGPPVLSTDCPSGPAEILGDGRYGQLVPVGDCERLAQAVAETLDAPLAGYALRQRARQLQSGSLGAYGRLMLGG